VAAVTALYPSESELAILVLGTKRAKDWPRVASYLEDKHGLPRVDELLGGRFWPAVVAYFHVRHGVPAFDHDRILSRVRIVPFAPDRKTPRQPISEPRKRKPDSTDK
jgi:hypothetical protein